MKSLIIKNFRPATLLKRDSGTHILLSFTEHIWTAASAFIDLKN